MTTSVTWTLKYEDGTTYLHLEQIGFEKEDQAFNGAKFGWVRMSEVLKKLLGDI
ncbi:SRPBCC domain-containing protein [Gottfriedia acidiceleris]|uniref:SRPBCC domain-containing protein n=1 Tax=Bacillaceae TaxID=186817 RepID=UPI00336C0F31